MNISKTFYFCAAVLIIVAPLLIGRDLTPDNELRYLSIADEALRNGSFFAFSNHGVPYADKPPLYLWLLMLCRWIAGGWATWLLGLLSVVPALATAVLMCRWTENAMPKDSKITAMAVLLTTAMLAGSAVVVRMDMLMTLFIVLSVRTFYNMYKGIGNRKIQRWLFPLYMFLALFTKGPLGLIFPIVGITLFLVMKKDLRRWTAFFGFRTWGVLIVLSAAWFLAVWAEGGSAYLDNLLFHQTMDRAVNAFHHKRPAWYYCTAVLYCLAPWTLLAIGCIIAAIKQELVKTDLERLLLAVSVATFVVLTCISSKLAIYLLPMLPFTVYLMMLLLPHYENSTLTRLGLGLPAVIFVLVLPAALFLLEQDKFTIYKQPGFVAAAVVLTVTGIEACRTLIMRKPLHRAMMSIACGMGLAVFAAGFSICRINTAIGYGSVCRQAEAMSENGKIPIFVDKNIKNAADMDVYLPHFKIVNSENSGLINVNEKSILITRGQGGEKLKCRILSPIN